MFRLQRLEITGFKSFADHTEITFIGDGITAVVGPNGCGKSNVAESIAWVLGEQRAKSLRGAEMKDVIFAGTRSRSPSGMAEVVLHLVRDDNFGGADDDGIGDIDSTLEEIDEEAFDASSLDAAENAIHATDENEAVAASLNASLSNDDSLNANVDSDMHAANLDALVSNKKTRHRSWRRAKTSISFAPGETVSVTRRLYRSGESEYLLNNRACRLRDIQDLFSGTGLAGAHYAIIEQGRIGQILSAKPMDRRALIEEAAGITKFRVRQRAAEARLDAARGNLNRVDDIVNEIERQAGSLRRQAAKARRYSTLRDELRELLRRVYRADYFSLTAKLEELCGGLTRITKEEHALASELVASTNAAREATALAREAEERLALERQSAADALLQRDRQAREYTYKEQQAAALEERIALVKTESESLRERLTTRTGEAEILRASDAELRSASERAAELLQAAEAAYNASLAEVRHVETEIERLRHELLQHTAVAERLMEIGRQQEAALERLHTQAEGLEREATRAQLAHEEAEGQAAELDAQMQIARARLGELLTERETIAATLLAAREAAHAATKENVNARNEYVQVQHRLDALAELDSRRALYSEAVQRLFSADESEKDFTHRGTLADVLRVEPRWERAVESVINSHLQAVIVPTPEDAVRAAAWLDANNAGRAAFLVAGLHGGAGNNNAKARNGATAVVEREDEANAFNFEHGKLREGDLRVKDLLGASPEIMSVLERTLTRELRARIVASLDDAMSGSLSNGETYVTESGECVTGGNLVTAGSDGRTKDKKDAGLFAFKREMRELESSVKELQNALAKAETRVAETAKRVGELEDGVLLLNEAVARAERDVVQFEMSDAQLKQDIERAARHIRVVADDAARLADEIKELEERRANSARDAHAAEDARTEVAAQVAAITNALAERRRTAETENERVNEHRSGAATAAERRRAAAADLRRTETEAQDLEHRLERFADEIEQSTARVAELRQAIGEIALSASEHEASEAEHARLLETRAQELFNAREQADALAAALNELNQRAAETRDARHAMEVQQAQTEARLNYLRESCMAELAQPIDELVSVETTNAEEAFDAQAGRERVEELRVRIENLGAVNMMALEELTEAEERLAFLTAQRQDIIDGISSTDEALREIKRRSRERFREAFEIVNQHFGELFAELFGGGRGEMTLIDTDDVLESGIDLIAQPPGKRLQNVLLLSGGEKAMAALALLLAVFRYRPSPFCLLDEVDAPLDEANIGRFTAKISEMSKRTQFIVITHNKRTMEVARALYGVTMQEAGVSKLVSAKFE